MDTSLQVWYYIRPFAPNPVGMSASAAEIYVSIGNDRFSCIVTFAACIRCDLKRAALTVCFLCNWHSSLISFGSFVRFPLARKVAKYFYEATMHNM